MVVFCFQNLYLFEYSFQSFFAVFQCLQPVSDIFPFPCSAQMCLKGIYPYIQIIVIQNIPHVKMRNGLNITLLAAF